MISKKIAPLELAAFVAVLAAFAAGCGSSGSCDCKRGEKCVSGKCVIDPLWCDSDSMCSAGFKCDLKASQCVQTTETELDGDRDEIERADEEDAPQDEEEEIEEVEEPDELEEIEEAEDGDAGDEAESSEITDETPVETDEQAETPESDSGMFYYNHMETLPKFKPGVQTHMFSSRDLTGANSDFNRTNLYREGSDYVIADVMAAGCVTRMWFAETNQIGTVKIFFDDASDPKYAMTIDKYFDGFNPPFYKPLVGSYGSGFTSYVPLCFKKRIKIQTTGMPRYYQIQYQTYINADDVAAHTGDEDYKTAVDALNGAGNPLISWENEAKEASTMKIASGAAKTVYALPSEGVITQLMLLPSPFDSETLRNARLKIYFDGMSDPSVDVPISHMFLSGYSEEEIISAPAGMKTSGYYYFFMPMPYWNGFKIEVENGSAQELTLSYDIRYTLEAMNRDAGTFYAVYKRENPLSLEDYVIADVSGRGHYVGTMLFMRSGTEYTRDFLYGDDKIYVDGRIGPQWWGTGTDNYFNGHLRFVGNVYLNPLFGRPYEPSLGSGVYGFSAFRWHVGDFITFNSSLKFKLEHGGDHPVAANYESVAFYYRSCLSALVLNDTLNVGSLDECAAHDFEIAAESDFAGHQNVCGCFEVGSGCQGSGSSCIGDYMIYSGRGIKPPSPAVKAAMKFTMKVDPNNVGARIVRILDYRKQNQNAEVYVDGVMAGYWYTPGSDINAIWLESAIDIPATLTQGKNSVSVEVKYKDGQEWNAFQFKSYSYLPSGISTGPGTPLNLRALDATGDSVSLAWDAPTSGTNPLYYHVYRANDPNIPPMTATEVGKVTTAAFKDLGLTPQTNYYYKIVAEDCTGVRGTASDEITVKTGLEPIYFEAEDIADLDSSVPTGKAKVIDDAGASGGKKVCLYGVSSSGYLILKPNVDMPGRYRISTWFVKGPDGATTIVDIDNSALGSEIDLYSPQIEYAPEMELGSYNVTSAGVKTLKYRIWGRNASSNGYAICVDKVLFKQ